MLGLPFKNAKLNSDSFLRAPKPFHRTSGASTCSCGSCATFTLQAQDPFSNSQDTIYSCASSYNENADESTCDRESKSPSDMLPPVEPLHPPPSGLTPPHIAPSDTSKPPPRPPRAARLPKQTSANSPALTSRKLSSPKRQYCYDPFVEFQLPRCSIESRRSCSRGDSIDLDPDLDNPTARTFKSGPILPWQAVKSYDNSDFAKPLACLMLDTDTGTYDTTITALDKDAVLQMPQRPPRRANGTLASSVSYASLRSILSSRNSDRDDHSDGKLIARPRTSSVLAGKALITSAFRKLSVSTTTFTGISSQDSHLSTSSSWTHRSSRAKITPPSALASLAVVMQDSGGSNSDSESEAVTSPMSSVLTLPHIAVPEMERETSKTIKEEAAMSTLGSPNLSDPMREGHLSLPSYHRGLRKQMYPPRVRYAVQPASAKPPVRWRSPNVSPSPHLVAPFEQPSLSRPRAAFDGFRGRLL